MSEVMQVEIGDACPLDGIDKRGIQVDGLPAIGPREHPVHIKTPAFLPLAQDRQRHTGQRDAALLAILGPLQSHGSLVQVEMRPAQHENLHLPSCRS